MHACPTVLPIFVFLMLSTSHINRCHAISLTISLSLYLSLTISLCLSFSPSHWQVRMQNHQKSNSPIGQSA